MRIRLPTGLGGIEELVGERFILSPIETVIGIHLAYAVEKPFGVHALYRNWPTVANNSRGTGCLNRVSCRFDGPGCRGITFSDLIRGPCFFVCVAPSCGQLFFAAFLSAPKLFAVS